MKWDKAFCCNLMRAWIGFGANRPKLVRASALCTDKSVGATEAGMLAAGLKLKASWTLKDIREIQEAMRGYEALEFDRSTCGLSSVR